MKFYLSIAMAIILMTGTVNAQHSKQKVNIGIKGGLNIFTIHNSDGQEYDPKAGFHAGLIAHIHLSRQLALQPEIVYSSEGAKYTIDGLSESNHYTINLGYINMPVMLQYMFDNGFRFQAGPQIGVLVHAKSKSETNNTSSDVKDNYKTFAFSLGAGVGYVHPPTGFGIDARFNLGLSDINENSNIESTNRGFQLGVFYLFNHKKMSMGQRKATHN
jgi:Outer membrane protein beta-barrel domain